MVNCFSRLLYLLIAVLLRLRRQREQMKAEEDQEAFPRRVHLTHVVTQLASVLMGRTGTAISGGRYCEGRAVHRAMATHGRDDALVHQLALTGRKARALALVVPARRGRAGAEG